MPVTASAESKPAVELEVELHDAQLEVWESEARFKVVACGRRFGKTFLAVNWLLSRACSMPRSINWWVAPLVDQTDVAVRFFMEAMPSELVSMNWTKKTARLWNGAIVAFKTASKPDALRSEGLDSLVMDEAAFISEQAWPYALRPALADKRGCALLIGTFDGENWFYDMYQRGQDVQRPEWDSWRFPSSSNPFLDPEEIEEARATSTKAAFEQEWMANPLVYVGAVFDGELLQAAIERGAALDPEQPASNVHGGLDWGYTNPTALELARITPDDGIEWIHEQLWHAVELTDRCEQIADACERYAVELLAVDAEAPTEIRTLSETFRRRGLRTQIQPVAFGKYKTAGIETRRFHLERGKEAISPACPQLAADSKRYRYKEIKKDAEEVEKIKKVNDHTVDAATAFYATRASSLVTGERAA